MARDQSSGNPQVSFLTKQSLGSYFSMFFFTGFYCSLFRKINGKAKISLQKAKLPGWVPSKVASKCPYANPF